MIYRVAIALTFLLLIPGCSDPGHDGRLTRIEETIPESPEEALSCLDSINPEDLSDADRHYYDLLTIKAGDKGYIRHTSDSTVLSVIDYYSTHKGDGLYAEALYYGGRVYCDMGDSPTALRYFRMALDNLPENTPDIDLKANILSQTGRLLTDLRLYEEAIPYIEESIRLGEDAEDTVNMVYDIQLLGGTYFRDKKYPSAEHCFNKALSLSPNLPESFKAKSRMYLAAIKYETGDMDSALNLIRGIPESVGPIVRNNAMAYASKIYLQKDLLDSAYVYAYELVHSRDQINKETGYQTLLSPKLRKYIPSDTLYQYFNDYGRLLEAYHDNHKVELSINQQNFYNYQRHEIERRKEEARNLTLVRWIGGISSVCLILIICLLYYKNKTRKALIELHVALENTSKLNGNINGAGTGSTTADDNFKETGDDLREDVPDSELVKTPFLTTKAEEELREKLRKELLSLYNKNTVIKISAVILESEAYKRVQEYIRQKQILSYENPLWDELECAVLKSSPKFKDNLQLLTQSRLTSVDLHTALLIKCHIQPTQMSIILGRSKGAIVSRRESLCLKIFGEKLGTKVIDGIIRLL